MKTILFIPLLLSLSITADYIYLHCEADDSYSKYERRGIAAGTVSNTYLIKISKQFEDLGNFQFVDIDLIQIHMYEDYRIYHDLDFVIWHLETQKGRRNDKEYEIESLHTSSSPSCMENESELKGEAYDCIISSPTYTLDINRETLKFMREKRDRGQCYISNQETNTIILNMARAILKDNIRLENEKIEKEKQERLDKLKRNKI
jgi:hypothetical protein